MGPWAVRDPLHPFRPGCSFDTIRKLAATGRLTATTVIRGPTTRQSWLFAGRTPAVANLLGLCHNCQREVNPDAAECPGCGASFGHDADRQFLGLAPVHLLPGQASPESIASAPALSRSVSGAQPTVREAAVADLREEPETTAILAAARRRMARLRAAVVVLAVLLIVLGAVIAGAVAGWIPVPEANARKPGPSALSEKAALPSAARNQTAPSEQAAPDAPPAADSAPTEPSAVPPGPPEAEPAAAPQTEPATPPPAPGDRGHRLRDRLLAALAADPPDTVSALAACDEAEASSIDTQSWRSLVAARGEWRTMRSLP